MKAAPAKPNDASGGGRETVLKGLHETRQGMRCLENFVARGRLRSEEKDPQLAADIRAFVDPHTYADPELKSSRRYTNLSAAEVRRALIDKGHSEKELPSDRAVSTWLLAPTLCYNGAHWM
ncbi:MAG: hypothetical protein ACXVA6_18370 [Isosphaeraceae bacterium]